MPATVATMTTKRAALQRSSPRPMAKGTEMSGANDDSVAPTARSVPGLATLTRAGVGALFPIGIVTLFVAVSVWRRGSEARRRLASIPFLSSMCPDW